MKKLFLFATVCLVMAMFASCKMSCTCEGSDPRAMRVNLDDKLFLNCDEMTEYYHHMGFYDVKCW